MKYQRSRSCYSEVIANVKVCCTTYYICMQAHKHMHRQTKNQYNLQIFSTGGIKSIAFSDRFCFKDVYEISSFFLIIKDIVYVLFDLILYIPVNTFSECRDRSSWVEPVY